MSISERAEAQRKKLVRVLLESENTLSLATVSQDGSPRVCPLFYITRDTFRLYWVSAESSEHSMNIAVSNEVSIAIYRSTERWRKICGLQMRGHAGVVLDPHLRKEIISDYAARFQLGRLLRLGVSRSALFEFIPSWIRYIDNSRHFGYKFELTT